MTHKTDRNDLCPCGSQKKYKRCCINTPVVSVEDAYYRLRQLEANVLNEHLFPYVMDHLPEEILSRVIKEVIPETLFVEFAELFLTTFLVPWLMFNWIPGYHLDTLEGWSLTEPLALQYSLKYAKRLSAEQKKFMTEMCQTHYSFFVILESVPGHSVLIKDVLLEHEQIIREQTASRLMKTGDMILARVFTLDEQSIFVGLAPMVIPKVYEHHVIELRERFIKESQVKKLTPELLKYEREYDVFNCFFSIIQTVQTKSMPTLFKRIWAHLKAKLGI